MNYQESGIVRPVLRTGIDERALSPTSITKGSINASLPTGDRKTFAVCEFCSDTHLWCFFFSQQWCFFRFLPQLLKSVLFTCLVLFLEHLGQAILAKILWMKEKCAMSWKCIVFKHRNKIKYSTISFVIYLEYLYRYTNRETNTFVKNSRLTRNTWY